ncbi:putative pentatricopeptide repeat-containing protein [Tanacetum coccineum]
MLCTIDILGRVGKLDEAMDLVNNMPFEANASVWGALLGAAKTHKNVDLGEIAAHKLMLLQPEKSGTHVILSNIYASAETSNGSTISETDLVLVAIIGKAFTSTADHEASVTAAADN